MSRKKGTAKYTDHVAVAVEPSQKSSLQEAADERGVDLSVVARWSFDLWLERNTRKGAKTA